MTEVNISTSVCDIQRMIIICSVGSRKINFLLLYLLDFPFSHSLKYIYFWAPLLVQKKKKSLKENPKPQVNVASNYLEHFQKSFFFQKNYLNSNTIKALACFFFISGL